MSVVVVASYPFVTIPLVLPRCLPLAYHLSTVPERLTGNPTVHALLPHFRTHFAVDFLFVFPITLPLASPPLYPPPYYVALAAIAML